MLDAVVSHPKCHSFFAEVLSLMASMPADEQSGLINSDDIETLVTMLDEYKTHQVMENACGAICNIVGQNLALCRCRLQKNVRPPSFQWWSCRSTHSRTGCGRGPL